MSADEPITMPNGKALMPDENGFVSGRFVVSKHLLGQDVDVRNDALSEMLTGSDLLMDVGFDVVSAQGDDVTVVISGDPTMVLEAEGNSPAI